MYLSKNITPLFLEHGLDPATIRSNPKSSRDKTVIIYSCRCGAVVERSTVRTLKSRPFCKTCVPDSQIYFQKFIEPIFIEHRLDITSIVSKPANAKDTVRLVYRCRCGDITSRTPRLFKQKPLCDGCIPKSKTGKKAPTFEVFEKMIEADGYRFADRDEAMAQYVDTKSSVSLVDPDGTEYLSTYNRFQQGHRSRSAAVADSKVSLVDVKQRIAEAGFEWIDGERYINSSTPIDVLCGCGEIASIRLSGIHKDRVGCDLCYRYNRKYPWVYVEGIAERSGCTLISDGTDYRGRDSIIQAICPCGTEVMKNVRCFLKAPNCSKCSLIARKITNSERYGHGNYLASEFGKKAIKDYWMRTYGVDHCMKVPEIQRKVQETCLRNNGVRCILAADHVRELAIKAHVEKWGAPPGSVKEIREKMIATNLERYGVEYPLSSEDVQKSIKENNLEKYGHEVFLASEEGKKLMIEKYGHECFLQSEEGKKLMIEKYGHEVFLQSEEGKKLMMEKYGAPHAMQVPELFKKAQRSSYALKSYRFPSGRIEQLQGYEWMCVDHLLKDGVKEDDIVLCCKKVPMVKYRLAGENTDRRYFMDLYIESEERGIEVKSPWTYSRDIEKNKAKWKAASLVCKGGFDIYIFDKKTEVVIVRMKDGVEIIE